jgi:hypothetical protein
VEPERFSTALQRIRGFGDLRRNVSNQAIRSWGNLFREGGSLP